MNDSELKQLWQQAELKPALQASDMEIVRRMKRKMRKFDHKIFWRDLRELAACAFILFWFGPGVFGDGSKLCRIGHLVLVLSAIGIGAELIYSQRLGRRHRQSASVRDFFGGEIAKVRRQAMLLNSVLWWYLLPLDLGLALITLGTEGPLLDKIIYMGVCAFVTAVLWWANRYAARKVLDPLQKELEEIRASVPEFLETNPDSEYEK